MNQDWPILIKEAPQIAKNVTIFTLWPTYEKLVVNCFPNYSYIYTVMRSAFVDTLIPLD